MAINILDVIDSANKLLRACQELSAIDPTTADGLTAAANAATAIKNASHNLRQPFDKLEDKAKDLANSNKDNVAQRKKDLMVLIDLGGATGEKPTPLKELFANVSNSLIDAQKNLNESSLKYSAELDARLPQTLYGIPSVKAEMRVGFNKMETKGINLFLFTSSSQRQEFAESTVSFEVVGSPPPPGPVAYGDYVVPLPKFLVGGAKRADLLDKISKAKTLPGGFGALIDSMPLAVVMRYEPLPEEKPIDGWSYYLVLWPARNSADVKEANWLRLLILNLAEDEQETLHFTDDENSAVASIFEPPPQNVTPLPGKGVLYITRSTTNSLVNNFTPDQLALLVIQLCDGLMRTNMTARFWLDSVKYNPPQLKS
jgi:hypothetical protein